MVAGHLLPLAQAVQAVAVQEEVVPVLAPPGQRILAAVEAVPLMVGQMAALAAPA